MFFFITVAVVMESLHNIETLTKQSKTRLNKLVHFLGMVEGEALT